MPEPTHPTIDVSRLSDGWPEVDIAAAVTAALSAAEILNGGELSVVLSSDAHIRDLNRTYRGKDGPTNVLSFPMPVETGLMGDVVLALETLRREAREQGKSFEHHVAHMLVHGVLHLQGFDHQDEASAVDMEAREVRALARLGIADPYAGRASGPD
ncbi:MAG: rRNA maturation RNase YbeY [Litorimonas sp.]